MGLRCGNNSSTIPSTLSRGSRPDENTASDPARPDAVQVQGQQRGWDSAAVTAAAESHRRSSPSAWLRVTRRLPVIARLDDSSLLSRTGELTASITAADVIVTCAGAAAAGRPPPRPVTPATGLSITISNPGTTSQPAARQDQYLTPRAAPQVPALPLVQVAVLDAGQSAYKDKLVELVRRIGSSHPTAGGRDVAC